ncbi:uncharacterized protein LOC125543175 [Triticum urartu]|uniref:Rho termination factor-like N-terminal domain-containing protein n=2 Tax=Triticum urartu TaxID=4572 RepID=A0A8R7PPG8_TRIUA|nr:uncharacterized protein LOC125543175 [Triticum urartu]
MGGILMQHHQISPSPLRKAAFPGSFALPRDFALHRAPLRGSLPCSSSLTVRSEANGYPPSRMAVKKHSKEELIEFFSGIQAAITRDSPKASGRTRKPSSPAGTLQEAGMKLQPHEGLHQDGQPNLEDMKVPELRDMARVRGMRGYSKLKKGELIDRLRGLA